MILADAERVLEAAFPTQGVRIEHTPKGSYKVVKANGEVIGAAFDLTKALQQACTPVLEAEKKRLRDEADMKTLLFINFNKFLQEKYADEFRVWLEARAPQAEATPGGGVGAELPAKQLVQIVPG